MPTAEEVRKEAEDFLPWQQAKEMLLAYADLLDAMEEAKQSGHPFPEVLGHVERYAAEKQKARKE